MATPSHIMIMYMLWMVTSLLVGYSHEQGAGQDLLGGVYPSPQASPLVGQRQSRVPSQQVIVPGGFQHQLYSNQFQNLRGLDAGGSRLAQSPISIQNQQFFLPRDPYGRTVPGRSPTSPLTSAKPTSSRSLTPNFVEIVSPNPQRHVGGGRGSNGRIQTATTLLNQPINPASLTLKNIPTDVQYEYYDETDGDLLYQYPNDFNDPAGHTSSLSGNRQTGQYFTEISSKTKASQRNPTPTVTSIKKEPTRNPPPSSTTTTTAQSDTGAGQTSGPTAQVSSKAPISSGTSGRLFRTNRPPTAPSSTSRETSSSFIPLVDENEEPEQELVLNGRSVQSKSHRGNSLSGKQILSHIRTGTVPPFSSSSNSSGSQRPSAPASDKNNSSRTRGVYSRTQIKSSAERNSSLSSNSRRPALLRGANNSSAGSNKLASRPPIIIRPRNLTRSRQSKRNKEDAITSSSTYRPDPKFDQGGSGSSENPNAANSLPSVEDYTVEYVEYPFNNEDNSSIVEYYEVSEETAQALLQRAKAKATTHRKPVEHSLSSKSNTSTNNNNNSNETATKVTVSVSSKSSYSSTSTTSTTTPAPGLENSSSSEESLQDQLNPSGEVVVSVATTKSVSGKKGSRGDVTEAPRRQTLTTATPRVTFSRATGSSRVVASVQTSRSVGKGKTQDKHNKPIGDSMPSGAETAPEYYEEEYTYPDNYPVLNNDGGSSLRRPEERERGNSDQYNQHEYSHEVSIQPPSISPTRSAVNSELGNAVSSVSVSHGYRESSEESAGLKNGDEQGYDDSDAEHENDAPQPRKLPSKKGEIPLNHFETLVEDVSELEMDHPMRTVNQGDLSPPPDDEASYHMPSHPSTAIPVLATTTTVPPPSSSTTERRKDPLSSIFSSIRFAEVSPDFLPPGFKLPSPSSPPQIPASSTATTTTTSTQATPVESEGKKALGIQFQEISISSLLPKGYKPRPFSTKDAALQPTTTTTKRPVDPSTGKPIDPLEAIKSIVKFQEIAIPGLVPKDYTPPPQSDRPEEEKEPNVTSVLAGIRFETPSNLLPPGFKPPASPQPIIPIKFETPANLLPKGFKPSSNDESIDPIKFEFPVNLLPPGYKPPSAGSTEASKPNDAATISTTRKPGGVVFPTKPGGVVFPTKPGGSRIGRPTTTEAPKGDTPLPPAVRIATGWPTRKTTAFTGWPTPPTTPVPPTSSTTTTTTTPPSTTTRATTTTTTPPPKRSPLGTCPQAICRLEATIRIVGGVKWVPEFQDINTDEYKHLETTVKRELDGAYRSSGLAPWYRKVEIEGFNRGSVIVDYFLLLDGIDRDLSSDSVVRQFHKSLLDSADELPYYDESDSPDQLVSNGRLRFGRYTIDPRYTDFKVVNITKDSGPLAQDTLIPQWGIAVIVIGLASLLFVIIFGVTVLVNRHKNSKKKNAVSLTQEMLSEFNKSHMGSGAGGLDNYGADDLYNMDDVWNNDKPMDKTFDRKPAKRPSKEGNYYDSWRSEWNGYYYNGNYYGDSGYAPSRRRSDYDTNF